ncbi:MAG: DUF6191 domain-containing protein [Nakamurella sp.]
MKRSPPLWTSGHPGSPALDRRSAVGVQPCRTQRPAGSSRESQEGAGVCTRRTVGWPGAAAARLTYAETVGPLGELGALFNPGMRHEIEERKSKANRREEEGNARDGDIRIDLTSGVAVINLSGRPEPTAAAPGETEAETSESGHIEPDDIEPDDIELGDRANHGEPDNTESNDTVPQHRAADSDEPDDTNDGTWADPTDGAEVAALIPPIERPTARERATTRSVSSKAASHAASGTKPSDSKPSATPGNSARAAQIPRSKASRAAR